MSETTAGTLATTQIIHVDATPRQKRTMGALNASVFVDEDGTISVVPNDATAAYVLRSHGLGLRVGTRMTMNGATPDGSGVFERSRFEALNLIPSREPMLHGANEGTGIPLTREQYDKLKGALDEIRAQPTQRKRNVRRK